MNKKQIDFLKKVLDKDLKEYPELQPCFSYQPVGTTESILKVIKEFIKKETFQNIQISTYTNMGFVNQREQLKGMNGNNYLLAIDMEPNSLRTTRITIWKENSGTPKKNYTHKDDGWNPFQ